MFVITKKAWSARSFFNVRVFNIPDEPWGDCSLISQIYAAVSGDICPASLSTLSPLFPLLPFSPSDCSIFVPCRNEVAEGSYWITLLFVRLSVSLSTAFNNFKTFDRILIKSHTGLLLADFWTLYQGWPDWPILWHIYFSDGEIYSGAELTSSLSTAFNNFKTFDRILIKSHTGLLLADFWTLYQGRPDWPILWRIYFSDGEIYSGAELTSWIFQWDLTLQLLIWSFYSWIDILLNDFLPD